MKTMAFLLVSASLPAIQNLRIRLCRCGSAVLWGVFAGLTPALIAASGVPALPAVRAEIGVTRLLDHPLARIGYRLDGSRSEVWLGLGWRGFDDALGVQFRRDSIREGRPIWFMHCPWRRKPGETFAEFAVQLPKAKPIVLALSLGLREDAPHSDGVRYRVAVDGKTLFAKLCTWKGLRPFRVDLGRYAGRRIRLRLTVDPGPARNTTDDWALWGKADIEAGAPEQIAAARRKAEKQAAARREKAFERAGKLAALDLTPLSTAGAHGVRPGTLGKVENTVARRNGAVVFRARDRWDDLAFVVHPAAGPLGALAVRSRGTALNPPPLAGSVRFGSRYAGSRAFLLESTRLAGDSGALECAYRLADSNAADSAIRLRVRWSIRGKSLRFEFNAPAGPFAGVQLAVLGGRDVPAPFGPRASYREDARLYLAVTPDLWRSNASRIGPSGSYYTALTDGRTNPLHDVFYFTISSLYPEVLPGTPYPPSPFLGELAKRVILDVWAGSFAHDAGWLRQMARYGVSHCVIIKHVWQRDGYDCTYPDTMPANAKQGGDAGLRALVRTAQALGHRFCVHENYYDYYPNAEDFRAADCCLDPNGRRTKGWQHSRVKAWFLKPSKLMDYVRRFSPEIRKRYGCDAAYHDIMPNWHVDYDAKAPGAGMIRYTHAQTRKLVEFDHALFGGPVLFEAVNTTLAGLYDGGTSGPLNEQSLPLAVAPELLVVHPKQSNHGMSYYERWLEWGYGPGWSSYVMTNRERDHYRAMTVAFGRTGFIGHQLMETPHGVVREYYLFQAFGRAYTGQPVVRLRYEGDRPGQWLDAGTAVRCNRLERLRATYRGGQEVYVNLGRRDWKIAGRVLPQFGSLTTGPRATAWTARIDGQIADFARYDGVVYADARSHWWHPVEDPHPIRARALRFKDLGGGRFRIAVEWSPGRRIGRNLTVFWHFRDRRRIYFQRDHKPPLPTRSWRPGTAILDGPFPFSVPKTAPSQCRFVVGLYDRSGREPLYGKATELSLGTLRIERAAGRGVRRIRFVPAAARLPRGADPRRYATDNNADRRILDFGEAATNGALVLRPAPSGPGRILTPVPLGAVFDVGLRGPVRRVIAEDAAGKPLAEVSLQRRSGRTWFRTAPVSARRFRILGAARQLEPARPQGAD